MKNKSVATKSRRKRKRLPDLGDEADWTFAVDPKTREILDVKDAHGRSRLSQSQSHK